MTHDIRGMAPTTRAKLRRASILGLSGLFVLAACASPALAQRGHGHGGGGGQRGGGHAQGGGGRNGGYGGEGHGGGRGYGGWGGGYYPGPALIYGSPYYCTPALIYLPGPDYDACE